MHSHNCQLLGAGPQSVPTRQVCSGQLLLSEGAGETAESRAVPASWSLRTLKKTPAGQGYTEWFCFRGVQGRLL